MANDGYKTICDKMGAVYTEMKTLVDAANVDGEMVPAVEEKYSQLKLQYASLEAQRTRNQELMGMDKTVSVAAPEVRASNMQIERGIKMNEARGTEQYAAAFDKYLKNGEHTSPVEMRVLNEGTGGTVLPPIEFDQNIMKKLLTMTSVRNLAKKLTLSSSSREVVYENASTIAYWTSEATAPLTTGQPTFDKITLTPKRLAALVRVSNELVNDADSRGGDFSITSILAEQFARIFAQTEETALLSAASVSGAPASLLVDAGLTTSPAGTTGVTAAQIITWIYSLPRQYRSHPSCAIIVNDATLGVIRSLGTAGGTVSYFWQNSGALGEPDRLMGIPVYASAAMPTIPTSAAATTIGIIGAWDYCLMALTGGYETKIMRERYADTNEVGFLAQSRMDCKLSLSDLAFKGLRTAAS
jgi:HK97 family phage major capsid protein